MDEAQDDYAEALKIDRQLAQQSPAVYLPDLAMTLTDFGRLNAAQGQMDEARKDYEEAVNIDRQLAQQKPVAYSRNLVMTLNNLGRVDRLQNRTEESRTHYQEALDLLRQLPQDDRYARDQAALENSLEELSRGKSGTGKQ
jgi:tetratricopeptide (TPR) repeat protein